MSIRRRKWTTAKGIEREAWIVDYVDGQGHRHIETFAKKKEADEYHSAVKVDISKGVHIAPNKSKTVAQAADDWLVLIEREGRERSTLDQYRQHVRLHIVPRLGAERIAKLTTPRVETFKDDLLAAISRPLAKKVLVSLKSILREAQRTGAAAQNVAASVRINADKRSKRRLEAGVDIPLPSEVRSVLHSATAKRRALLAVAAFAGLRSSELRGLRWDDVDFAKQEITVRQRADRYGKIGAPKSDAGKRTVPIGPFLANTLKEWKVACPATALGIVFPTSRGRIDHHANILRALEPIMVQAGVVAADGGAKYALHAFRHFFASWSINSKGDGGLGLPPKVVQERMGHSSIVMTMDTYGHLFPRDEDGRDLAEAEAKLFAV